MKLASDIVKEAVETDKPVFDTDKLAVSLRKYELRVCTDTSFNSKGPYTTVDWLISASVILASSKSCQPVKPLALEPQTYTESSDPMANELSLL